MKTTTHAAPLGRWTAGVLLAAGLLAQRAPAQGVQWATAHANRARFDSPLGYQVVVDAAGNTYVAGTGGANAEFDGLGPSAQRGTGSLFVLKRGPGGQPLWLVRGGRTALPLAMALDGAGQPVIAGSFTGTATFGPATLTSAGGTDGFVARLDAAGNWLSAARAGGPLADQFAGLAVRPDGTAYVTGRFLQTATFGALPALATASGAATADTDVLVARLSPANVWQWATAAGQRGPDAGQGVVADAAGRVSVSGYFKDSADFAPLPRLHARPNNLYQRGGSQDVFVAQLDAATGTWQWHTRAGGLREDAALALAADASGGLYVGGFFRQDIDFGDSLGIGILTARGTTDVLLAHLSPAGTWQWATQGGSINGSGTGSIGTLDDQALTVAVDPAGTRVTTGGILAGGTKRFGPDPATLNLSATGLRAFVAQANAATGTWLNAALLGALNFSQTTGVAVGAGGAIYATGWHIGTAVFSGTYRASPNNRLPDFPNFVTSSNRTVFAAKLDPNTGIWTQPLLPDNGGNIQVRATAHDAAGNAYVTGRFDGSVVLPTPVPTRLINTGGTDVFVARLDPAGNWLWAVAGRANGILADDGVGIVVDAAGRVTVAGTTHNGSLTFGALTLTGGTGSVGAGLTNLNGTPRSTTFVAQFDAATGAVRWVTSLLGSLDSQGFALCRDPLSDDLTVAGTFQGTLTSTSGGAVSATATGQYDGFLGRISPAGQWQWLRRAGGTGIGNGSVYNNLLFTGVRQDASGAYAVAGMVSGTVQLGSSTIGSSIPNYIMAPFVARLDATGTTWAWARADAATERMQQEQYPAAVVDAAGNVYAGSPNYSLLPTLRQYGPTGVLLRAITVPNATIPYNMMAVDAGGGLVVAGSSSGSAAIPFGSFSVAGGQRFVARLAPTGTWSWAGAVPGALLGTLGMVDAGGTMTVGATSNLGANANLVARLLAPPIITAFTPTTGSIGTVVVLTGTGFTDASAVAFNGTPAPGFVVSNGGTTITVSAPLGVTTGPITVTSAGGTGSSPTNFVVPAAASACTWTGAVDTRWELPGNWLPAVVPTDSTDVTIPPVPNQPVVTTAAACAALTVQCSASLTIAALPTAGYLKVNKTALMQGGGVPTDARLIMSGGTLEAKSSFYPNGVFQATGGLVTLTGLQPQRLGGSGGNQTEFWNLTIGPAGAMQVNGISIQRLLTLHGDLAINGTGLFLRSNAGGTAMVVNSGGQLFGVGYMERYIGGGNAGLGYRHYSSPMLASAFPTFGDLAMAGFVPVVNPAYNTTGNTVRPFPTVFGFDEARQGATGVPGPVGFEQGWVSPAALTDLLAVGRGYTVNLPGTAKVSLFGNFATGPVAVGALSRSGTGPFAGYHLLGNPYPAPIDWDNVAKPAGLDDAVYVFRSTGPYAGFYDSYVNGLGTLAGGEIAAMQGFFVRVSQPVPAFAFTDAARLTTYSSPTFRRGTADARPVLALALRPAGAGGSAEADKAFIYFEAGASAALDARYDALKLPNPGGLGLASLLGGQAFAINGLAPLGAAPLGAAPLGAAPLLLPLSVAVPAPGRYELAVDQLVNFAPGTRLWLRDALLNTRTPLLPGTRYAFALAGTAAPGRFAVEFGSAGALASAAQLLEAQVQVWPNPAAGAAGATVAAPAGARVSLLNALGQALRPALAVGATGALRLPTAGLAAGIYVLRVQAGATTVSRRLVVE